MRYKLFILVLILPLVIIARAQDGNNKYVDSLEKVLQHTNTTADTAKANVLFLLSDHWSLYDSAKGVNYARQALQLKLNRYYQGLAFFYLGQAYFDYDHQRANQAYDRAIALLQNFEGKNALLIRSRAWANKGALLQRQSRNREHIDILLNYAIPLAIRSGDSLRVARMYNDVGLPFKNFKEFDKAIYYFKRSATILQRHNDRSVTLADAYINIAQCYLLSDADSSGRIYLDSAKNILSNVENGSYHISYYINDALYHTHLQNWSTATASLDEAMRIAQTFNTPGLRPSVLYGYATLYKAREQYPQLKDALLQLEKDSNYLTLADKVLVWQQLAEAENVLGNNGEAYRWLMKSKTLNDSLLNAQTHLQVAELETQYNFLEKEKEVLVLNERNTRQRLVLIIAVAIMLIASAVFFYFYKQRKTRAEKKLQYLQQQKQIDIAEALLMGEERERQRLAQDLHDGLGGLLASVKINMSGLAPEDDPRFRKVVGQIDTSVNELRRIAHNMMPEALLRSGLETALRDMCEAIDAAELHVEFQALNIDKQMPANTQIVIYRIVQELLANVLKHSGATEVFVQCSQLDNYFYITVEDNGHGFTEKPGSNHKKGMGLQNVQTRVDFLNGKMDVNSSVTGTIINIELLCRN